MCQANPASKDDDNKRSTIHKSTKLAKDEEWLTRFDLQQFALDIKQLGDTFEQSQGSLDVAHLNKMVWWSNACAAIGLLSMWHSVNPVTIFAISTWTCTRWTMIAHHTCHGGYDKCHPNKSRWNRFKFGLGSTWRRICDWLDWMLPEAWNVEHNNRHHYCLSEVEDPDLVENNLVEIRNLKAPLFVKYLIVMGAMVSWKWFYYSPNTYKELKLARLRRRGESVPDGVVPSDAVTFKVLLTGKNPFYTMSEFISVVIGPYLLIRFILLPLPCLFLGDYLNLDGTAMYWNAMYNLLLAEVLTNVHSFIIVVTNHAGNDMYRFREGCKPFSGSFYLRQVLASVDFDMGTDTVDFMHGWLNYQIEHHLWPNLSMLSYQKSAPIVREICAKHGVPYIKENVFIRLKKTIDIMIGATSMRWFPEEYEKKFLDLDTELEAKKKAAFAKAL
jgi:fatty acid desaturase